MAAPAFTIPADVLEAYKALKLRRAHKFLVISVNPESGEVAVETAGGPKDSLETFFDALPTTDCRCGPIFRPLLRFIICGMYVLHRVPFTGDFPHPACIRPP